MGSLGSFLSYTFAVVVVFAKEMTRSSALTKLGCINSELYVFYTLNRNTTSKDRPELSPA